MHLALYLAIYLSVPYISTSLPPDLSIHIRVYLPTHLCNYLSIYLLLSLSLCLYLSISLSLHHSISLSLYLIQLSVCKSVCLFYAHKPGMQASLHAYMHA